MSFLQSMNKARFALVATTMAVLVVGLGLQMSQWSRQWLYGDQYALLTPAVQYLESGELAPFTKGMSGGGRIPGGLLQLVIATPLRVVADFRAPALAMGFSQLVAMLVLLAVGVAAAGHRFAAALAAVYWLSPWRLYHAGFLWEPGFLLLPAALHLGCCWLLRTDTPAAAPPHSRARLLASFGLGVILVATLQIHASFLLLVVATILLAWRGRIRIGLPGFLAGAALAGITLLPTALAFLNRELPALQPQLDRRVALPLLVISNAGKAVVYWLRMGSADIGRRLRQTAWLSETPPGTDAPFALPAALVNAVVVLSTATVLIALYASWRYLVAPQARAGATDGRLEWLRRYAVVWLAAVVVSAALSPVPVQGWHLLIALHAACVAPALWLADAWRRGGRARALGAAFVAILFITSFLVGLGHPSYLRPAEPHARQQNIPELLRPLIPAAPSRR